MENTVRFGGNPPLSPLFVGVAQQMYGNAATSTPSKYEQEPEGLCLCGPKAGEQSRGMSQTQSSISQSTRSIATVRFPAAIGWATPTPPD